MSDFHDDYPQYEIMYNHGEEEGKKARRTLWNVFWVMLFITIFELVVGFMAPSHGWSGTWWIKTLFISLTIIKAAAIVLWFMHLGHEVKSFKYTILAPYIVFMLYTIFIVLTEGTYAARAENKSRVDPIFIEQQAKLRHHNSSEGAATVEQGAEGHGAAEAEGHH